jgi:lysozyme family protein
MESYRAAIGKVLENEGGYSKNPADPGGETFKGISRRFYPKWEGWSIIDINHFEPRLDEMVIQFYKEQFWDKLRLSEVSDDFVSSLILNFGVNIGKKQITKKVQRILKVQVDGVIGPITIFKLNQFLKTNRSEFVYHLLLEVAELYVQIVNKNKTQKVFLLGWFNRIMSSYYDYERSN